MTEARLNRPRRVDPDRLAGLEEEREFLLRSLSDLEDERDSGEIDETDYLALKDDYTRRAADVVRGIETQQAALAEAPPRSWRRTAGWLVGLAVLGTVAGFVIGQTAGDRAAEETISGGARQSVSTRLVQAQRLLGDPERWDDAVDIYDDVLEEQPGNVEAITYRAWLQYRSGAELEPLLVAWAEASQIDAAYAPAIVFRAIALAEAGRYDEAAPVLGALPPLEELPGEVAILVTSSGLFGRVFGEAAYDELVDAVAPSLVELGLTTDAALEAASYLLTTDKADRVVASLKLYDAVLLDDPDEPRALSRRALVLAQASTGEASLLASALELVDRAVSANPDNIEALVSRATLYATIDADIACADLSTVAALGSTAGVELEPALSDQVDRLMGSLAC